MARAALVALAACAAPRFAAPPDPFPIPPLQPFTDAHDWVLQVDLVYKVTGTTDSVVVPAGFVTDFASIPHFFQSGMPVNDVHLGPSVVHDYLYWSQACTRTQADRLYFIAMTQQGVPENERNSMYRAVRTGGDPSWHENESDKAAGLPRVLPPLNRKIPVGVSWPVYREQLRRAGVPVDTGVVMTRGFCARGE